MCTVKEKLRLLGDHLKPNPRRKFGPGTSGSMVECPRHREFYDSHESCPTCLSWAEAVGEPQKAEPEPDTSEDTDPFFSWA